MQVELDFENLRVAAREWYEEGWAILKISPSLNSTNRGEMIKRALPERSLAAGYYAWIGYLRWLADANEIARFVKLSGAEVEGIRIVNAARDEFARSHPSCHRCGATNDKFAMRCRECKAEFK